MEMRSAGRSQRDFRQECRLHKMAIVTNESSQKARQITEEERLSYAKWLIVYTVSDKKGVRFTYWTPSK